MWLRFLSENNLFNNFINDTPRENIKLSGRNNLVVHNCVPQAPLKIMSQSWELPNPIWALRTPGI